MHTMKWAFWMTGNYGSQADGKYDKNVVPEINNINYKDMVADNGTMAARHYRPPVYRDLHLECDNWTGGEREAAAVDVH